jgi:transcriptional regulator with XRE-family HTH domain
MREVFLIEMGKRIQERRKTLRLSQEELAEKADISKQTVSRAENAQRELGAGNLFNIAKALEVSTDFLLSGTYTEKDVLNLSHRAANLTGRQFTYLEDIIKKYIDMCNEEIV